MWRDSWCALWTERVPRSTWPVRCFAGPAQDLWCLNEAARLGAEHPAWFLDPLQASRLGENLAASLLAVWDERGTLAARPPAMTAHTSCPPHGNMIPVEIREPESPQRGRAYERQVVPPVTIPVHRAVDVLVAGGGSSGATAAITAAREGIHTVLLDMNPGPGGTGTYGGVDSYWYGTPRRFRRQPRTAGQRPAHLPQSHRRQVEHRCQGVRAARSGERRGCRMPVQQHHHRRPDRCRSRSGSRRRQQVGSLCHIG